MTPTPRYPHPRPPPEWLRLLAVRPLALVAPPLCWGCGRPAPLREPLCHGCRRALRWLPPEPGDLAGVPCFAPVAYEGPARELVRGLKFRAARGLADAMAAPIVARAPAGLLASGVLVPVPAHPRRERRRGFNQAAALAAAIGRRSAAPVSACLERGGPATAQVGRDRPARLASAGGAVRLRNGLGAPASAVLVDDVATTGATIAACAAALRQAGSAYVAAVAFARTPGR